MKPGPSEDPERERRAEGAKASPGKGEVTVEPESRRILRRRTWETSRQKNTERTRSHASVVGPGVPLLTRVMIRCHPLIYRVCKKVRTRKTRWTKPEIYG